MQSKLQTYKDLFVTAYMERSHGQLWNAEYFSPQSERVVAIPGLQRSHADAIEMAKQCIDEELAMIAIAEQFGQLIDELQKQGHGIEAIFQGLAECCDRRPGLADLVGGLEALVD